jgi:DNA-binding LytR/AlgR family response regulator
MKVIIIEDEKLAVERLELLLRQIEPTVQIVAALESVEQGVRLFRESTVTADLLLLDIHLADGSAFEIFRQVEIRIPIVFTTAYDQYAVEAFKVLSIDYLLKPIIREDLAKAIEKMRVLRNTPSLPLPRYQEPGSQAPFPRSGYKNRLLGQVGPKLFFINTSDIALLSADNRIVHLITMDNAKYLVDHTLEELEQELDPTSFFRVNRSMIVNAAAVAQIKPFINHRLRLMLKNQVEGEDVIVSRDRVTGFKKWADS